MLLATGCLLSICSLLTNRSSRNRVGLILVGLQGAEDVCCGMQGAGPDDPQAREVQGEQAQLTDQAMLLHIQASSSDLLGANNHAMEFVDADRQHRQAVL